ncbi:MAG: leucyl/phenylalanyl-tRNA--protein transferase [Candidatus Promineofilum sp.]|nr:leucyl/phenylalanyl-tRNA--protein transferase [Promineifilum sp.]MCW5861728.1 leucyl/phenylalanyl-tRNA--protein transferase [Anaerolineae bacterium]
MDLSPETLLSAYMQGIFPMAHEDGRIYWYSPNPRAILPLDGLHVSQSLRRVLHRGAFDVRFDTDFAAVIAACAAPAPGREQTWISAELQRAYVDLHRLGFAHSVEAWQGAELVGGLYGVSIRGFFAGESMFSRCRDASKVALYYLVQHLRARDFRLLDTQFQTAHLMKVGAVEISRRRYLALLRQALAVKTAFN